MIVREISFFNFFSHPNERKTAVYSLPQKPDNVIAQKMSGEHEQNQSVKIEEQHHSPAEEN